MTIQIYGSDCSWAVIRLSKTDFITARIRSQYPQEDGGGVVIHTGTLPSKRINLPPKPLPVRKQPSVLLMFTDPNTGCFVYDGYVYNISSVLNVKRFLSMFIYLNSPLNDLLFSTLGIPFNDSIGGFLSLNVEDLNMFGLQRTWFLPNVRVISFSLSSVL